MATTRILDADHALLQELSMQTGKQQQEIIHEALAGFHRERMLNDINAAFSRLRHDERAWQDERAERAAWDGTTNDGVTSD